jgi:hypothetical protein
MRYSSSHFVLLTYLLQHRINKRGSQKDMEQKKNGNYFFYDDGADDDAEDEEFEGI